MKTIFVGGGTPTALNMEQTKKLLDIINRRLRPFAPNCELTFEANPGDLPKEKLNVLLEGGSTELVLVCKRFVMSYLKRLDAGHTREDAFVQFEKRRKLVLKILM